MVVGGESDRSMALAGSSPLTTSTWRGASATPTDKESVVEEEEEEEDDEEEEGEGCSIGREGRPRGEEG